MKEITERDLLQCIMEDLERVGISAIPPRPAGFGITVKEFAEKVNCSTSVARSMLQKGEAKGILKHKKMSIEAGGYALVYYEPEKEDKNGH